MTSHGKKKWNSKTNIKEDVPKFVYHKTYIPNILCLIYVCMLVLSTLWFFPVLIRSTIGTSTIDGPIASLAQGRALGPNASLRKGPNDDLLL